DELPPEFREVIVLRELEELSYKEIAEVAGVPVGTVMSRRARRRRGLGGGRGHGCVAAVARPPAARGGAVRANGGLLTGRIPSSRASSTPTWMASSACPRRPSSRHTSAPVPTAPAWSSGAAR